MDEKIKEKKSWDYCGSTATVLLIDLKSNLFWSCHVGDSSLLYDWTLLTNPHHPSNPTETERLDKIKKIHHVIKKNRLNGCLAVSRSLGDAAFRVFGLISTPEIKTGSIIKESSINGESGESSTTDVKETEKESENDLKETGRPKKKAKDTAIQNFSVIFRRT